MRLQQARLERQVTQLLRHRIVQFTGQRTVPESRLPTLLFTAVTEQTHADVHGLRGLLQQLAPARAGRARRIEQQPAAAAGLVAVGYGTQQAMHAPLPTRAAGLGGFTRCRGTPRTVRHALATLDHAAPSRCRLDTGQGQVQLATGHQCFETVQENRQGTVSVHQAQGQPGQQLAHAARLFGTDTPQPERPPLHSCSHSRSLPVACSAVGKDEQLPCPEWSLCTAYPQRGSAFSGLRDFSP
ncbi:hypothetical protein D3C84_738580 [compost metagenome]